jgi:hypothetical protein
MKATLRIEQLDITFSRRARDKGIKKAIDHADAVHPSWSEIAYGHFRTFVGLQKGTFVIEEFRAWVKDLIVAPPSLRSFGALTMKAAREGLITQVGYTKVKNARAHMANVAMWRRG